MSDSRPTGDELASFKMLPPGYSSLYKELSSPWARARHLEKVWFPALRGGFGSVSIGLDVLNKAEGRGEGGAWELGNQ